jgi:hypothetical protein
VGKDHPLAGEGRVRGNISNISNFSHLPPSEGEAVKKLKKVGWKVKKILDYTYDYMLFSFYIP